MKPGLRHKDYLLGLIGVDNVLALEVEGPFESATEASGQLWRFQVAPSAIIMSVELFEATGTTIVDSVGSHLILPFEVCRDDLLLLAGRRSDGTTPMLGSWPESKVDDAIGAFEKAASPALLARVTGLMHERLGTVRTFFWTGATSAPQGAR